MTDIQVSVLNAKITTLKKRLDKMADLIIDNEAQRLDDQIFTNDCVGELHKKLNNHIKEGYENKKKV